MTSIRADASDSDELPRSVYVAQMAAWAAATLWIMLIILLAMFLFGAPILRHALAPYGLLVALVFLRALLSTALFVLAGVLIGRRRRSGAVVALVLFLWSAVSGPMSAVVRQRYVGLTVTFTALAILGAVLVIRAWPELRPARAAV